jgi:hypothetical protein
MFITILATIPYPFFLLEMVTIAVIIRQSFRRSVRRLQELNSTSSNSNINSNNANRFKDTTNSNGLPPPDYATVVIEADRRRREAEEDEDDIYLEPRDALNNFQLRTTPLVTTEIGSFSLDLGAFYSSKLLSRFFFGYCSDIFYDIVHFMQA